MNTLSIKNIRAVEVLDSRGIPTVQVTISTNNNITAVATVPSGTSVGTYEAKEIRDTDNNRYFYKGVSKAVSIINTTISDHIIGMDIMDVNLIDRKLISLDNTLDKSSLGSNSILAISICLRKLISSALNIDLYRYIGGSVISFPIPMFNIINGGAHSNNKISIQEFLIVPVNITSLSEQIRVCVEIYNSLKEYLIKNKYSTNVGLEGGFDIYNISDSCKALDILSNIIDRCNYKDKVYISLDIASNEIYDKSNDLYTIDNNTFNRNELSQYYMKLINKYNIFSLEDPYSENDIDGWNILYSKIKESNKETILIGDDLFCTNSYRFNSLISTSNVANGIIIKPNQVGTIYETIQTVQLADKYGFKKITSHRSGDTEDTFIVDFSFGIRSDYVKFGAPSRGERTCKYNRMLTIYDKEINI